MSINFRRKIFNSFKVRMYASLLVPYLIFFIFLVLGQIISPGYFSLDHLQSILSLAAPLGLMVMGETMVLILGGDEIDISVGDEASSAIIIGALLLQFYPLWLTTLIILFQGIVFGALNGLGRRYLKIPALIMTFLTGRLLYGLSIFVTRGTPSGLASPEVIKLSSFPMSTMLWVIFSVLLILVLAKTVFGRILYAIGDNPVAAYTTGIPINLVSIIVYMLSGALSAFSGLLLLGIFMIPAGYGVVSSYSLQAVVATILGGVSAGKGSYIGAIGGVLVITVLNSFFTIFNIPEAERTLLYGVTLATILIFYGRREAIRK